MDKEQTNYAFIDSQNLNLGVLGTGWKLDFKKFRIFLREKYGVTKAFLFLGFIPENRSLYRKLQDDGYELIFKPVVKRCGTTKGNCDAELVLQTMIEYDSFDSAIVVSGDGDFHCLYVYLEQQGKLVKIGIPHRRRYSSLLRKFRKYFFFVGDLRKKLE